MTTHIPLNPGAFVLVRHYPDMSSLLDAVGPFESTEAAEDAAAKLAGFTAECWTVIPLRVLRSGGAA